MSFAQCLEEVELRIAAACAKAARPRESVLLIAVSKTHGEDRIREAYAAGQRHFGENYAQEFAAKAEALADLPGIVWHFIGHLQSNKVKLVAPRVHVMHTVDRAALADELAKRAQAFGRSIDVLLEVNIAGEDQKHGCRVDDLEALVAHVQKQGPLALRGLMTVPPNDDIATKDAFEDLARLAKSHALPELSMGMSQDLEVAIACGATMVRIGTALFGERGKHAQTV